MTDATNRLILAAADEIRCDIESLPSRLASETYFSGRELLPGEVVGAWAELPIEAKAVAVLYANSLADEDARRGDLPSE